MYVDQEFEVNIRNTSLLFYTHRENISCNFFNVDVYGHDKKLYRLVINYKVSTTAIAQIEH